MVEEGKGLVVEEGIMMEESSSGGGRERVSCGGRDNDGGK